VEGTSLKYGYGSEKGKSSSRRARVSRQQKQKITLVWCSQKRSGSAAVERRYYLHLARRGSLGPLDTFAEKQFFFRAYVN
jgi:hypothetical protein